MNVLFHVTVILQTASSFTYLPKDDELTFPSVSNTVMRKHLARIQDLPHHVLVVYDIYFCSGSLIHSLIVVTTASCLDRSRQKKTTVKLGANTVTGPGQVIPVTETKIHEYYKRSSDIHNDIALLALKEHARFTSKVQIIALVEPEVALRVGTTIEVSGWGHSNLPQKFLNQLVWSEMVVLDKTECQKHFGRLITPSSFCAKYQIVSEQRLSDNGGPAIYRNLLVGMLSFGGTKRDEPHIAVFTNASYFHRWITLNSRRFLEKYCVNCDDL